MCLVILSLSESEQRSARICRESDKSWRTINHEENPKFIDKALTQSYFDSSGYPELSFETTNASDKDYFVIQPKKVLQPRLHHRYEITTKCTIVGTNSKEFKSETVDISEGGIFLKDIIPTWVAGYFVVMIADKFQLMCSLVEDQKEKRRVQIVSEESDFNFIQYKNWINKL